MTPILLGVVLLAALIALLPVWRLRVAGWPPGWLFSAWVVYAVTTLAAASFGVAARFLVPILVVAYLAPFVAGPERLARVLRGRRAPEPRTVIDVTPAPPTAIAPPEVETDPDGDGGAA